MSRLEPLRDALPSRRALVLVTLLSALTALLLAALSGCHRSTVDVMVKAEGPVGRSHR